MRIRLSGFLLAALSLASIPLSASAQLPARDCAMPPPSAGAGTVHITVYETEALSSATVGSQDVVTYAGRIWVEPGDTPLYVAIDSGKSIIWQFLGDTKRIERAVIVSQTTGPNSGYPKLPPLAGATGLPKDKLYFFDRLECSFRDRVADPAAPSPSRTLKAYLGRAPDFSVNAYSATSIDIPSGKIGSVAPKDPPLIISGFADKLKVDEGVEAVIYPGIIPPIDDLYRFNPGGVTTIDPKSVVSSQPAAAYEVLPQHAGLVQLLKSGALKQNDKGAYVVQRQTRFPAGLAVETFIVPKGVPMPDGDPVHACVLAEDPAVKSRGYCMR